MPEESQHSFSGSELDLDVAQPDDFHILVDFDTVAPAPAAMPGGGPEEPTPAGMPQAAAQIEVRSQEAITAAMNTIRAMALQTDQMLQSIPGGAQPRMIKVKFGIRLDFQVGAILAKSGAGATMEVEMEWARRSDDVLRVLNAATDVQEALFADAGAPASGDDGAG